MLFLSILGIDNWTNKTFVRAVPSKMYKIWRPDVFVLVKTDYSYSSIGVDSDDSAEDELPDIFSFTNLIPPPPPTPSSININTSDEVGAFKEKVNECFKCSICYEVKYDIMFCTQCGRNIGCPGCISLVNECPLCRGKFQENSFPTPMKISGLEELLK